MPAAAAILVLEKGDPAVTYFRLPPPVIRFRCFKHRRRVARDNTVKYHGHTLQLLPDHKRRSYAGAVVVVLEGLDGRLSLPHEGRIIASQEAPPSPGWDLSEGVESLRPTLPSRPPIPGVRLIHRQRSLSP